MKSANVPLGQQSKLLRVLETGELERVGSSRTRKVNVRVIAATNADVSVEVDRGRFRPDLLFRLNTIEVRLPALRDRREDIPHLASYFLRTFAERYRTNVRNFQRDALQLMTKHPWPGNVRELSHAVERGVLMARDESVSSADLGLHSAQERGNTIDSMSLDDVESFLVRKTLTRHGGNVSQAAKALGLSRSAMYRRIPEVQRSELRDVGRVPSQGSRASNDSGGLAENQVLIVADRFRGRGTIPRSKRSPPSLTGFRREESETPSEQGARPEGAGGVLDGTSRSPTKRNAALADGSGAVADNS